MLLCCTEDIQVLAEDLLYASLKCSRYVHVSKGYHQVFVPTILSTERNFPFVPIGTLPIMV
jgi:hypothetical protein